MKTAILIACAVPAQAITITGTDYNGADLIPANGDVLQGTFTNVRLFEVGPGTTAFVASGVPLVVYAATISVRGVIDGTGRGQSGGSGGAVDSAGLAGFGGGPSGSGGGGAGLTLKGGAGGGGGGAGGDGAGAAAGSGAGGAGYGSTGTYTSPLTDDDAAMGSGGGGGGGNSSIPGGSGASGGAAIYLEASSMSVTGSILANGSTATAVSDGNILPGNRPAAGGGGGGGTILLRVPGILHLFSGSRLAANGGNGGNVNTLAAGTISPGGGGGAGRVKVFRRLQGDFSVTITTSPGLPGGRDSGFTAGSLDVPQPGTGIVVGFNPSFGAVASSPTAFAAQRVYPTSVAWFWDAGTDFGDSTGSAISLFRLFPGGTNPPYPVPQISTSALAVGTTETGLTPNTTYTRLVTAFTNWGDSAPSLAVTTYTLASLPGSGAPVFSAMADTSLAFNWAANGNPAYTFYETQRALASSFAGAVSVSTAGTSTGPSGLTPNTTYFFRVRARNIAGSLTDFTAAQSTATLATAPASPSFTGVMVTSLTFSWSGGANPADTDYYLEVSTDNYFTIFYSTMTTATSVQVTGLTPGDLYLFHVRARNRNSVDTAFTNTISVRPGNLADTSQPTPPGTPSSDRKYSYDGTTVFSWTAGASSVGILDYLLEIGTTPGGSDFFSGSTATVSYTATGLTTGKTYFARVKARSNAGVFSPFSGISDGLTVFIPAQQQALSKPAAWPNPFNPSQGPVQIGFKLDGPGPVVMRIYTLQGRLVRETTQEFSSGGNQIITWDGTNTGGVRVSPGGYTIQLKKSSGDQRLKILVLY